MKSLIQDLYPSDYRCYLKQEFLERTKVNSRYSLRAFARDLGVSISTISDVISGKKDLSLQRAQRIALKIGLSDEQKKHFEDLIFWKKSKSPDARREIEKRMLRRSSSHFEEMGEHAFSQLNDWRIFAVYKALDLKSCNASVESLAEITGLQKVVVRELVDRLVEAKILFKEADTVKVSAENLERIPQGPSKIMKQFHKDVMNKALREIDLQGFAEREYSTTILSFKKSEMKEAKKYLKKVRQEFVRRFSPGREGDEVYCLSSQFFSLTSGREKR